MGHDDRAHQTRGDSPRGRPHVIQFILLILEGNVECFGKVLAEEMRGSCLQRFVVLHHAFNAVGAHCTRKFLAFAFQTGEHRHGHVIFRERAIHVEHADGFLFRFFSVA